MQYSFAAAIARERTRVPRLPRRPPDNYLRDAMVDDAGRAGRRVRLHAPAADRPVPDADRERRRPVADEAVAARAGGGAADPEAAVRLAGAARLRRASSRSTRGTAIADHRPLGNQSRARKRMYWELSKLRQQLNGVRHYEPTGDEEFPGSPARFPPGSGQRRDPRQEEVGAAPHRDEARHAGHALADAVGRDRERPAVGLGRRRDRVGVVVEAAELRVVQPRVLTNSNWRAMFALRQMKWSPRSVSSRRRIAPSVVRQLACRTRGRGGGCGGGG